MLKYFSISHKLINKNDNNANCTSQCVCVCFGERYEEEREVCRRERGQERGGLSHIKSATV